MLKICISSVTFTSIYSTDLHEDGESEVQVEVRSEGGRGRGEAVVAHGGHHPVEEHRAGPDQDCRRPEEVDKCGRGYGVCRGHCVLVHSTLSDMVELPSLVIDPGGLLQDAAQLSLLVLRYQPPRRLWEQPPEYQQEQVGSRQH